MILELLFTIGIGICGTISFYYFKLAIREDKTLFVFSACLWLTLMVKLISFLI